jgi:hypothetical protein
MVTHDYYEKANTVVRILSLQRVLEIYGETKADLRSNPRAQKPRRRGAWYLGFAAGYATQVDFVSRSKDSSVTITEAWDTSPSFNLEGGYRWKYFGLRGSWLDYGTVSFAGESTGNGPLGWGYGGISGRSEMNSRGAGIYGRLPIADDRAAVVAGVDYRKWHRTRVLADRTGAETPPFTKGGEDKHYEAGFEIVLMPRRLGRRALMRISYGVVKSEPKVQEALIGLLYEF